MWPHTSCYSVIKKRNLTKKKKRFVVTVFQENPFILILSSRLCYMIIIINLMLAKLVFNILIVVNIKALSNILTQKKNKIK